ncbi:hypothetical protein N7481_008074 [Penicillium waksmanii]|uniref:uncharacterized protein n=1 Tax=Penicillium waksmanii TaxID=69791 RepID=UPI0025484648|nr:uncharacterized protein N7481_008074 [Penicillium waksmanii]KAJ5980776.1 hypothetical protein N7481_008074 [Penicillium waksmanii]
MASASLVSITAACSARRKVNTIGVVVDTLDPWKTRGSSYGVTFTIKDCEFDAPTWQGGLKVKYFNDNEAFLPIVQLNDVVLLRDIRVTNFQGKPTAVATQNDMVYWAVFRPQAGSGDHLSISRGPIAFETDPEEKRMAAILLANLTGEEPPAALQSYPTPTPAQVQPTAISRQPSHNFQTSAPVLKSSGLPMTLIQDVKVGRLTQLLGQVVKMNTFDSDKTLLYLTDYTVNTSLMDIKKDYEEDGVEGDAYGYLSRKKKNWPGPWGQLTLQVALWEPHASFAREYVKEGNLVHLTYVHVKDDRSGGVEAAVHRDKRFENKIHVNIISDAYDERARELLDRRKAYWRIHGKPKVQSDPNTNSMKTEEKAEKPKKSKQNTQEVRREEGQTVLSKPTARKKPNQHVKCLEYGIPVTWDVDSILSAETHINKISGDLTYKLPFQNLCYHPVLRVVDFYPPALEDFAVQVPLKALKNQKHEDDDLSPKYYTWEWRFCLLVEGTEPTNSKQQTRELMQIFVSEGDATHLLGLDADDLRNNSSRLHELREKLFLLWGDLEERKQESAATAIGDDEPWQPVKSSSVPFECCIREYGVKCSHKDPDAMAVDEEDRDICTQSGCFGWERRFAMFGTTIHS